VLLTYIPKSTYKDGTRTRPDYLVNRGPKKLRVHSGEKVAQKSRNSCTVNGRGCGCIGTVDSRRNFAQSYNQIQTLKECFFCHNCGAQLWMRVAAIVTASCAVSNRESRYPPYKWYQITTNQPTNLKNRKSQRMGFLVKKNSFWFQNPKFPGKNK